MGTGGLSKRTCKTLLIVVHVNGPLETWKILSMIYIELTSDVTMSERKFFEKRCKG